MRITMLAIGSRGDVQPYVALGRGLHAAGHAVTIGSHREFEPFVRGHGLDFAPIEGNPRAMLESEAGQAWLASGRNPIAFIRRMGRLLEPLFDHFVADTAAACADAEAIVFSPLGFAGYHVAEQRGVPCLGAFLQPFSRTGSRPTVFVPPGLGLGPLNGLTHRLIEQLMWQPFAGPANRWRRDSLGLPPLPLGPFGRIHRETPILYGYSPSVVPRPDDWPPQHQVTGYWFLDRPDDWCPPPALVDFLADGPPPVYVGFGSMAPADAERLTAVALDALARVDRRALLLAGWAGLGRAASSDRVLVVDAVPHDWLFPRMSALVHHGGAGTTASGLRAGVPAVVVPFFGDQPFWGDRVWRLGVGARPIQRKALTADRLAASIRFVLADEPTRARALALGARIRGEDGVGAAVRLFERYAASPSSRRPGPRPAERAPR
jgi:sterol 3beta-glucosyltransferase